MYIYMMTIMITLYTGNIDTERERKRYHTSKTVTMITSHTKITLNQKQLRTLGFDSSKTEERLSISV